MSPDPPSLDVHLHACNDALAPHERLAIAAGMHQWMREAIGRQIQQQRSDDEEPLSADELKWRVALRVYCAEPGVVQLIEEERLRNVSG